MRGWPEAYEPTSLYWGSANTALDYMFEEVEAKPSKEYPEIEVFKERVWCTREFEDGEVKEYFFSAEERQPRNSTLALAIASFIGPQLISSNTSNNRFSVHLVRVDPPDNQRVRIRNYIYTLGQLQVIHSDYSQDEAADYLNDASAQSRFMAERQPALDMGLHQPTDIEYMDFLADLDSFGRADKIIV